MTQNDNTTQGCAAAAKSIGKPFLDLLSSAVRVGALCLPLLAMPSHATRVGAFEGPKLRIGFCSLAMQRRASAPAPGSRAGSQGEKGRGPHQASRFHRPMAAGSGR